MEKDVPSEPDALRKLDCRARLVLLQFAKKDKITAQDVAGALGLSSRMVRLLLKKRGRIIGLFLRMLPIEAVRISYQQFVGNQSAK